MNESLYKTQEVVNIQKGGQHLRALTVCPWEWDLQVCVSVGPFRDTLNLQIPTVGGPSVWGFPGLCGYKILQPLKSLTRHDVIFAQDAVPILLEGAFQSSR